LPCDDACHRWNWFRRDQWWRRFRDGALERGGAKCAAVLSILGNPGNKLVLDATCGLGRHTVVMSHLAMSVVGSDANAYAVGMAREPAAVEGRRVGFFVSSWRNLAANTGHRFDAICVDSLMDCCEKREDLVASFAGIAGVLKRGGVFMFPGPEPGEKMREVLDGARQACPQFYVEWQHRADRCECACIHARYRGPDFIDDNLLYLAKEAASEPRLETAKVRQWFKWDRQCLDDAARSVGFSEVRTERFHGAVFGGTTFARIVGRK